MIDKKDIIQNQIIATFNIPDSLDDFVEEYEKELNYASIKLLGEEISNLNNKRLERDFYLKEANELAKICCSNFSLSKFENIENKIELFESDFSDNKDKLLNIIQKYNKKRDIKELNLNLNSIVSEIMGFCETKFKSAEKELAVYDAQIAENKTDIKNNGVVAFHVNIKKLFADQKLINSFLDKMKEFKDEKQQVKILFNAGFKDADLYEQGTPYVFNSETLNNIRYIKNKLNNIGYNNISFAEYYSNESRENNQEWSYNSVIKSNKYILNIINKIKSAKHTPLEAMIFIHSVATLIPFSNKNNDMINTYSPESLRSVVGMIENGEAVCSAYTHLVKAIVDGLNMKGLKAQLNCCYIKEGFVGSKFYKYLQGGNHAQNLISIDDAKYSVKGVYRNDCAWDAMRLDNDGNITKGQTFTFFMNTMQDIRNLKNMIYKPFNMIRMKDFDTYFIKSTKGYKMAKLQNYLADKEVKFYNTKKINFDTFVEAFENAYKKLGLTGKFIDNTIFKIVERSCNYAEKLFNSSSENIFKQLGKNIPNNDIEIKVNKSI